MTGRYTRNTAVGVGIAIGVAIAVALDNYLLGVSFGILAAAGMWAASKVARSGANSRGASTCSSLNPRQANSAWICR